MLKNDLGTNQNLSQKIKHIKVQTKFWLRRKISCHLVDFFISADHKIKIKNENKKAKNGQMPGSCQWTEKLWSMKLAVIPIVVGAFGIVPKSLEKRLGKLGIRERIETIQDIVYIEKVLETRGDLLSLRLPWKTTTWNWCEKLLWSKITYEDLNEY